MHLNGERCQDSDLALPDMHADVLPNRGTAHIGRRGKAGVEPATTASAYTAYTQYFPMLVPVRSGPYRNRVKS